MGVVKFSPRLFSRAVESRSFATQAVKLSCLTRRLSSTTYSNDSSKVRILEVAPRDGLQNIKASVPTATKIELIKRLASTGLLNIEPTSFVSPKWVPQLADCATVMEAILPLAEEKGISLPVLAPNLKGLQNAMKSKVKVVEVFASATEAFSKANQNCTVDEALAEARRVVETARKHGVAVRGVVSCIFSDPYSGPTPLSRVLYVVKEFLDMGCYEVGLGDTLGVGTPQATQNLLEHLLREIPADRLAGHFHDTYGQGVANVVAAYSMGLRSFDSSVAGLGGCPYARGAKGNVATEDIVYTLEKSGVSTGVDLDKLISVGGWISKELGMENGSRAGSALLAKKESVSVAGPPKAGEIQAGSASLTKKESSVSAAASPKPAESSPRVWKIDLQTPEFTVSRSDNVVKITLTRPQKGNIMTLNMLEGLANLFTTMAADPSIFHIVLAAEGKFFCTGMDLSTATDRTSTSGDTNFYAKVAGLFAAIDNAPQTTIAVINGPCYAGGAGLGFVFDIRLASAQASWTLSEIKLGLIPAIISRYLSREWGFSFLREAMLSGRQVQVDELYRIGAVHGVADDTEKLEVMLDETLDRLSYCAPQSAGICKQLLRLAWRNAGGERQDDFIQTTFQSMMIPGSEGEYGIQQFQKNIRRFRWSDFWSGRKANLEKQHA